MIDASFLRRGTAIMKNGPTPAALRTAAKGIAMSGKAFCVTINGFGRK
jgi:hypothetical protein